MIDKYQKEQMEKNIHYDNNQFSQFKVKSMIFREDSSLRKDKTKF